MVLKEAYEYQNFLSKLISQAELFLMNPGFITKCKEVHKRKSANPDAFDEEIEPKKDVDIDVDANTLVDLVVDIIKERKKLLDAIDAAKKSADINIDNAISINKTEQDFINVLSFMNQQKSTKYISSGVGYKFNAEGNQVQYIYDIENEVSIDFDRNSVRGLIKKYRKECNERSIQVDCAELNTVVDYNPKWDINSTLEEILGE